MRGNIIIKPNDNIYFKLLIMCGMKIFLNKGNFAKIIDPCKMGSYGNVYVTIWIHWLLPITRNISLQFLRTSEVDPLEILDKL